MESFHKLQNDGYLDFRYRGPIRLSESEVIPAIDSGTWLLAICVDDDTDDGFINILWHGIQRDGGTDLVITRHWLNTVDPSLEAFVHSVTMTAISEIETTQGLKCIGALIDEDIYDRCPQLAIDLWTKADCDVVTVVGLKSWVVPDLFDITFDQPVGARTAELPDSLPPSLMFPIDLAPQKVHPTMWSSFMHPKHWDAICDISRELKSNQTSITFFSGRNCSNALNRLRDGTIQANYIGGVDMMLWPVNIPQNIQELKDQLLQRVLQMAIEPESAKGFADEYAAAVNGWIINVYDKLKVGSLSSPMNGGSDIVVIESPELLPLIPLIKKYHPNKRIVVQWHECLLWRLVRTPGTLQNKAWEIFERDIKLADFIILDDDKEFTQPWKDGNMPKNYGRMAASYNPYGMLYKQGAEPSQVFHESAFEILRTNQHVPRFHRPFILHIGSFTDIEMMSAIIKNYVIFRTAIANSEGGPQPHLVICDTCYSMDISRYYQRQIMTLIRMKYPNHYKHISVFSVPRNDGLYAFLLSRCWVTMEFAFMNGMLSKIPLGFHYKVPVIVRPDFLSNYIEHGLNGYVADPFCGFDLAIRLKYLYHHPDMVTSVGEAGYNSLSSQMRAPGNTLQWLWVFKKLMEGKELTMKGRNAWDVMWEDLDTEAAARKELASLDREGTLPGRTRMGETDGAVRTRTSITPEGPFRPPQSTTSRAPAQSCSQGPFQPLSASPSQASAPGSPRGPFQPPVSASLAAPVLQSTPLGPIQKPCSYPTKRLHSLLEDESPENTKKAKTESTMASEPNGQGHFLQLLLLPPPPPPPTCPAKRPAPTDGELDTSRAQRIATGTSNTLERDQSSSLPMPGTVSPPPKKSRYYIPSEEELDLATPRKLGPASSHRPARSPPSAPFAPFASARKAAEPRSEEPQLMEMRALSLNKSQEQTTASSQSKGKDTAPVTFDALEQPSRQYTSKEKGKAPASAPHPTQLTMTAYSASPHIVYSYPAPVPLEYKYYTPPPGRSPYQTGLLQPLPPWATTVFKSSKGMASTPVISLSNPPPTEKIHTLIRQWTLGKKYNLSEDDQDDADQSLGHAEAESHAVHQPQYQAQAIRYPWIPEPPSDPRVDSPPPSRPETIEPSTTPVGLPIGEYSHGMSRPLGPRAPLLVHSEVSRPSTARPLQSSRTGLASQHDPSLANESIAESSTRATVESANGITRDASDASDASDSYDDELDDGVDLVEAAISDEQQMEAELRIRESIKEAAKIAARAFKDRRDFKCKSFYQFQR